MKTLLFLLSLPCWAGSSLILGDATVTNSNVAVRPANGTCRLEAFVHNVAALPGANARSLGDNACGINWQWLPLNAGDVRLQLYGDRVTGGSVCQITGLQSRLSNGFYIRFQLVPNGSGGEQRCQAWDLNGTRFFSATQRYTGTSGSNDRGASITGAGSGTNMSWGFVKLFTTSIGLQGRMPVHGENGDLLSWRFDGSLADSSGHGYTGSRSGSIAYATTPGQTLIQGVVKTSPAPAWTDRRTLRVGAINQLDATSSFSQADNNYKVSCDWALNATTPSSLALPFSDPTDNCSPTVVPSAFGDYYVTVSLRDAGGSSSSTSVHIGAANMDEAGVIESTDSNIAKIFGPMIALGWNPWGLADERHVYAHAARRSYYTAARSTAPSYSYGTPEWDTPQTGTIQYAWNGAIGSLGAAATSLTSGITNAATSIAVADASVLDLSNLPTRIQISSGDFRFEEIRICATSAVNGAATLSVCYDGRGVDDMSALPSVLGPTAWNAGAIVGQSLIKGTGTDFAGGPEQLCEGGPGPMGPVDYRTGTVSVAAGSATITGSGTNWTNNNNVNVGDAIRIEGTHASGTSFVFIAYVSALNSATSITSNRPFPADADSASGLTYQIIRPFYRLPVTAFTRPTQGGKGLIVWGGTSCESDTQAFFNTGYFGHDVGSMNGTAHTGETYSFVDWDNAYLNLSSQGGINFYGEDLAWYSLHFRSGLAEPKNTAELISNHWARYPFLRGGISGPVYPPLFEGGGVIGGITCIVVDPDCALSWPDMRGYIEQGETYALHGTCTSADSRDGGYLGDWLAMGALFDPDPTFRARWRAAMDDWEALENSCKGTDNSWANGFYTNFGGAPTLTFTNGSVLGTGSSLSPDVCMGVAAGTFSISGDTLTATGGSFSSATSNIHIVLNDGTNRLFTRITYVDATHVKLSAVWRGASAGNWMQLNAAIGGDSGMTVWGNDATSESLTENVECIYNSGSSITLERPWNFASGTYKPYKANLAGKGQQPYMLSIKAFGFTLAKQLDATLGTHFGTLLDLAATWVSNTGYDPEVKGMRYGTNFQSCEPAAQGVAGSFYKQPGCSYGLDIFSQIAARMLNGEASRAFVANTTNRLTRGTEAYSALWCSTNFNDPLFAVPPCDSSAPGDNLGASNLADPNLNGGKWSGFFFGMGMAHQWPTIGRPAGQAGRVAVGGRAEVNGVLQ